jgi:hypothetical protein
LCGFEEEAAHGRARTGASITPFGIVESVVFFHPVTLIPPLMLVRAPAIARHTTL